MEALEPLRFFSVVIPTYTPQPLYDWNYSGIPADWDNDGDVDFLAYREGKLIGGQQQPDGYILKYSAGPDLSQTFEAAAADLDLDGDLDLISVSNSPFEIRWQLNDGTGHFGQGTAQPLPAIVSHNVITEDLNRDGYPDLVVGCDSFTISQRLPETAILLNDGTGNYSPPTIVDGTGADSGQGSAAADFDGDGDIDLAVPMGSFSDRNLSGMIRILLNNGRGQFTNAPELTIGDSQTGYSHYVSAGDIDADGDIDLVSNRSAPGAMPGKYVNLLVLLLNDGTARFPVVKEVVTTPYSPWGKGPLTDLNGDTYPDLVFADQPRAAWNNGNGVLESPQQMSPSFYASRQPPVDYNRDGRIDIFGSTDFSSVRVFLLSSGFTDTLRPVASRPAYVYSPQAGNPAIRVDFSEDVRQTLRAADFQLTNLTTGQSIPTADLKLNYSPGDIASLLLPGSLPDGNYRLIIAASAVADIASNTLASDFSFDFAVLSGDANRDRKIDATDLGVLSANWQGTSKTFSQGDFNYDGKVDISDLYILSSKWQQALPPPVLPAIPAATTPARRTPLRVATSILT